MNIKLEKNIGQLILILGLMCISLSVLAAGDSSEEGKVAKVNDTIISQTTFDQEMVRAQQQITRGRGGLSDVQVQALKNDVLESMIGRELVYQVSQKQGTKVDPAEIDKQWEKIKGSFPSEGELNAALEKMDLTEAIIRSKIEQDLAINMVIQGTIVKNIVTSEQESKTYYDSHPESFRRPEEVKASHILIKVESSADESEKADAKKRLEEIRGRLKKGEDFAAVAKELSEGPSSENGGDLGYFSKGKMVKSFENAAFAMKTGEISDIVETQFGYHLIKRTAQRPEAIIPYEDVKERLQESIKNDKVQKKIGEYVSGLKQKAKIERYMKVSQ